MLLSFQFESFEDHHIQFQFEKLYSLEKQILMHTLHLDLNQFFIVRNKEKK